MRSSWQTALMEAITDPAELIRVLELDPGYGPAATRAAALFPLKVPRRFVALMRKGDPDDPLLRQVLPLAAECESTSGFVPDPLREAEFNPLPGLLHKYHGRVLLTVTGVCGVNCRFCFRRNFPYDKNQLGPEGREKILHYLAGDASLTEVILSGGDPLMATDTMLASLCQQLGTIPHLKRLRFHTRLPVMLPTRMTPGLLSALTVSRLQPVIVFHCNHPGEISPDFADALKPFRAAGVTLLNQSVLLAGVNDAADTLTNLCEALFEAGVLPYYLHLPDRVQGTAHFDVTEARAIVLHQQLSARLPGYLVPKLMSEVPGRNAKTPLFSKNLCTAQS